MNFVPRMVACAALLSFSGCGGSSPGVGVVGKVTYQGTPVEDGVIQFIPQPGTDGPIAGASIVDGTYSIQRHGGPIPGKYRVQIEGFKKLRQKSLKEMGPGLMGMDPKDAPGLMQDQWIKERVVPERYNTSSDLTAVVPEQSSVTLDYELIK